eukprot:89161-Amphidinium_carterae.1
MPEEMRIRRGSARLVTTDLRQAGTQQEVGKDKDKINESLLPLLLMECWCVPLTHNACAIVT